MDTATITWQAISSSTPRKGHMILLTRGERVTVGEIYLDATGKKIVVSWDGGFTKKEPPTEWAELPAPPVRSSGEVGT